MTFKIGQRWISNTESQLGLGIITELQGRQVSISFPATEEERIYATDCAPLSRIIFKEGDEILSLSSQLLKVKSYQEQEGIFIYTAEDETGNMVEVKESELHSFIKICTPQQRLFSGLFDKPSAFKLRIETLHNLSRLQQSPVNGLLGARTSHLPHQIYIANEVGHRYAPRVLLADEVGLGKTIEAGMILHYQIHTGRASRVLIVLPETLIHQWFVEMLRRFNLNFSIIDEQSFTELDPKQTENLFESKQLILCSLNLLTENKEAFKQAKSAIWDLIVVDEAHHLHWSLEHKSREYSRIEELTAKSKGLLLLTGTPEQVGIQGHFARLRLLDPARFFDLKRFIKEEEQYQTINELVQKLRDHKKTEELSNPIIKILKSYLGKQLPSDTQEVIKELLDHHGTSPVLFRNTRATIKGFPLRTLYSYPLLDSNPNVLLEQELVEPDKWVKNDPRVQWLAEKIKKLKSQKVLVICGYLTTALTLEHHLRTKFGISCVAFHEELSIVERDRAAAYFSDEEDGAQALICSEIGSEGRNFQFAHQLILFDLPLNPDLLEQRIGRLDRIGQQHSIEIHVPYLTNTYLEVLFRWYHEGLNLFEKSCSIGYALYEHFEKKLLSLIDKAEHKVDNAGVDKLINQTKEYSSELTQILSQGRDQLLEMNSFNLAKSQALIQAIELEENSDLLVNYMTKVFEEYGVEQEHHSDNTEILHPTTEMKSSYFPGLSDESLTVTYSRNKALIREDIQFLSWEHPMVTESMEMILDSELGNVTLCTINFKSIKPGTVFLESFYTLNCAAPKSLQLTRYLPLNPIRLFMDVSGKNLSHIVSYDQLNALCTPVKSHLGYPIISQLSEDIEGILKHSMLLAEKQMKSIIESSQLEMRQHISQELNRLKTLQKINPSIREEEITYLTNQIEECDYFIKQAALKLQALRVVINK